MRPSPSAPDSWALVVVHSRAVPYSAFRWCRAVPCTAVHSRALPCRAVPLHCRAVHCRAARCLSIVLEGLWEAPAPPWPLTCLALRCPGRRQLQVRVPSSEFPIVPHMLRGVLVFFPAAAHPRHHTPHSSPPLLSLLTRAQHMHGKYMRHASTYSRTHAHTRTHKTHVHCIIHPRRLHNILGTHMRHTSRYGRTRIIHIHMTRHIHDIRVGSAENGRYGIFSTPEGVRRGWSLSAAAIRDGRPGHSRRGIFSTPQGVRRGWSLSAAAIRDGRPGRSRRGIFSTPEGVRTWWSLSAADVRPGRPVHSRRGMFSTPYRGA